MTFDDSSANIDLVPGGLNKNLDDSSTRIDLVPDDLGKNLYEFALMAFQSQGRAQVVSNQTQLSYLGDPTGILSKATALQTHVRKMANFYLTTTTPQMITVFTGIDADYNLSRAMLPSIGNAQEAVKISKAVADNFRRKASDITKITERMNDTINLTVEAAKEFSEAVDQTVIKLDGDDGQIAAAGNAIEKVEAKIDEDIANIVKSSNEIGNGIKQLVRYGLTILTGGAADSGGDKESSKDKAEKSEPAKDEDGAETSSGDKKPEKDPFGDIDPFPVESIGSIEDGVGQSVAVMKALSDDNKRLAKLYQAMAELSAALTVCQAIQSQTTRFADGLTQTSTSRGTAAVSMAVLAGKYDALATQFGKVEDNSPEYLDLIQSIKTADDAWSAIITDMTDIERAFAGIGNMFPPAG